MQKEAGIATQSLQLKITEPFSLPRQPLGGARGAVCRCTCIRRIDFGGAGPVGAREGRLCSSWAEGKPPKIDNGLAWRGRSAGLRAGSSGGRR